MICLVAVGIVASGFVAYNLLLTPPTRAQLPVSSQKLGASRSQGAQTVASSGRKMIAALGRLEPQSETIDIGASGNDRLSRLLVQVGQTVAAGEGLAYLESYAERLAEKSYAESQLRDAGARLTAETAYGKASIAEAKIRLKQLKELPLLDIQAQEAKVRQLETDLAGTEKDLERFEGLRPRGTISQQEFDRHSILVRRTHEQLNSAKAVLAKLKAAYDINLLMARAQVRTARASAARAQITIGIASLTRNLELAQTRLDRTVLRAPIPGTILQIHTRPGEAISPQPILTMGDTRQMYAVAEVYETDIGLVRVGQQARITSQALPEVLTGKVVHIGNIVWKNDIFDVDPAADTDARVVEVKIALDQSAPAARLINLQVNVHVDLLENVGARH